MGKLTKLMRGIVEILNLIAIAALLAMLLLVCANVVMRYIFKSPIPGTYEITQMLMICLSPCIAVNILSKQCVWVDVFTSKLGRIGQMMIDVITLPLSVGIIGIMAWQGFNMIFTSIEKNSYSQIMNFRLYEWPFRAVYFVAMTAATLAAICFTIERLAEYRGGGMPHDESEVDRAKAEAGDLSAGSGKKQDGEADGNE